MKLSPGRLKHFIEVKNLVRPSNDVLCFHGTTLSGYFAAFANTIMVGMPMIPNLVARLRSSSESTLPNRISGSKSLAASPNAGAITWHGPHHEAQKSTTNGMSLLEA